MDQEAYVVLATLTVALSLLVLALTYFDFLRIYRQRREVRWLLKKLDPLWMRSEHPRRRLVSGK